MLRPIVKRFRHRAHLYHVPERRERTLRQHDGAPPAARVNDLRSRRLRKYGILKYTWTILYTERLM